MIMNIYFFRSVSALTISINNDNSNQTNFSIPEQQDDQPFPAESSQHSFYDYTRFSETDPRHWYWMARADIRERLQILRPMHYRAQNVIIFLGDGMGISTITASRILKGQIHGHHGEEGFLEFDRFPYSALIKTYNLDKQVPDSAGTATAYLTGVKANFYTLGVAAKVNKDHPDCNLVQKSSVDSILKWALDSGKAAGFVTTTRVTHATPGASYAHTQNRDWEYDIDESVVNPTTRHNCKDIARQLIEDEPGKSLNVILGGGRQSFMSDQELDPKGMLSEGHIHSVSGKRRDGRNLIEEWKLKRSKQDKDHSNFAYVNDTQSLHGVNYQKIHYLFGLFNYTNMEYEKLRDRSPNGEPSLTEMTEAAIKVLSNNPNGFVLLVEGGRIDHAHHDGFATLALHETLEMDRAIRRSREMLPMEDTLIVVTADHSHSLVINGYPNRGNPIQGESHSRDSFLIPYTTLMYTNGPGFRTIKQRTSQIHDNLYQLKYRVHSAVYTKEANHAGEDVAVFAIGPMAHLFGGTHEQSHIAHVMGFAACIGPYQQESHCQEGVDDKIRHKKIESGFRPFNPFNSEFEKRKTLNNGNHSVSQQLSLIVFLSIIIIWFHKIAI
ncbi:alkaline phosphatase-like isoform X2 [Dermatophagoides pteronyssinus]|uniref:alkaline phosphatase-like isoform X2 n=1 Tax=Dermatophagoides pteronyssinus TaxID=6956 RepID=UPI003F66E3E2